MQKPLSLPTRILLSGRYSSLPHLCLLCGAGDAMPRICLISTIDLGCLSRVTCQSGCQIFSFISGHVSQTPQQRNKRKEGSALLELLLSVDGSFTQLWLAGSGCGASQSAPREALEVHRGQTFSLLLKFSPHAVCFSVDS